MRGREGIGARTGVRGPGQSHYKLQHFYLGGPRLLKPKMAKTEFSSFPTKYTPPFIFPISINGTTIYPSLQSDLGVMFNFSLSPTPTCDPRETALPQKDIFYPTASLHFFCQSSSLGHQAPSSGQPQQPPDCPSAHILQTAPGEICSKCKSEQIPNLFKTLQ